MTMRYEVQYSERALRELKKMDKYTRQMIYSWIDKNLNGCEDPRQRGKGLTANRSGQWRYRIGDYRLICQIQDAQLVILALSVGHRSTIYKS
jgi:mRNA interferase RelE/StbE